MGLPGSEGRKFESSASGSFEGMRCHPDSFGGLPTGMNQQVGGSNPLAGSTRSLIRRGLGLPSRGVDDLDVCETSKISVGCADARALLDGHGR